MPNMKRYLKKAIILQNNPYRLPENRLAEYHGATFAEEFHRRGVEATKMVVGDPEKDRPISDLLSISSMEQRLSPDWWRQQDCDLIIFYGGQNPKNIPVLRTIKQGLPNCSLVLKMDAAYGPFLPTLKQFVDSLRALYVKDRHGHVGPQGHSSAPPILALARAAVKTLINCTPSHQRTLIRLFEIPDFVSYENVSALKEAQLWTEWHHRRALYQKLVWLGYPVRATFAAPRAIERKPGSIISVANWKHAKDLPLHSKSLALVLEKAPQATATLIGEHSKELLQMVLHHSPAAETRIVQIDEISNKALPDYLHAAEVFQLCSLTEGICSSVIEALCCGCSVALSTGIGVPCFTEFADDNCGTQARTRSVPDMADAVLSELELWKLKKRDPNHIRQKWSRTLVPNLCEHICEVTGFQLP